MEVEATHFRGKDDSHPKCIVFDSHPLALYHCYPEVPHHQDRATSFRFSLGGGWYEASLGCLEEILSPALRRRPRDQADPSDYGVLTWQTMLAGPHYHLSLVYLHEG